MAATQQQQLHPPPILMACPSSAAPYVEGPFMLRRATPAEVMQHSFEPGTWRYDPPPMAGVPRAVPGLIGSIAVRRPQQPPSRPPPLALPPNAQAHEDRSGTWALFRACEAKTAALHHGGGRAAPSARASNGTAAPATYPPGGMEGMQDGRRRVEAGLMENAAWRRTAVLSDRQQQPPAAMVGSSGGKRLPPSTGGGGAEEAGGRGGRLPQQGGKGMPPGRPVGPPGKRPAESNGGRKMSMSESSSASSSSGSSINPLDMMPAAPQAPAWPQVGAPCPPPPPPQGQAMEGGQQQAGGKRLLKRKRQEGQQGQDPSDEGRAVLTTIAASGLLAIKEVAGGGGSPTVEGGQQRSVKRRSASDDSLATCSSGNSSAGEEDTVEERSATEEDKRRKWMSKEQAKACQSKFDEWGGSLRGRQEEVIAFARSIGLSALQVEKRFAYIRKHYQRVTKKLTLDDDLASEGGAFAKCSGGVQSMLVQKLQDLAMHEVEGERLTRALIRLAASCRVNSKKVVVMPSRHQLQKLESSRQQPSQAGESSLPDYVVTELSSSPPSSEPKGPSLRECLQEEVDVTWATEDGHEPVALFHIESDCASLSSDVIRRCVDVRLRGTEAVSVVVVPRGKLEQVRRRLQAPWVHALMGAVQGLASNTRVLPEEAMDEALSDSKLLAQLSSGGLSTLLCKISEPVKP